MHSYITTEKKTETAILVAVIQQHQTDEQVRDYLDELDFLTETAGAKAVKRFTQRLEFPHPATYVGSGRLNEMALYVEENEIEMAIFDDELKATQLRNLEKALKCKILDRTNLILDIFAKRAQTAHAKVQVELAQYEYLLPRLAGLWTHLERQRGGIGMRGPGEKEIETDRRIIRQRIALLKEELKKIDRQKMTQRQNRGKMVRVSLVGYTNVGKSTLMNVLSKSDVFAENKLFATLDTTVRKVVIGNLPFLLSDTVGFIRKLPHHLVESFKSTLDEVRESDILMHVVDISHPGYEEQIDTVQLTLKELGVAEKLTFMVFNKVDAFTYTQKEESDLAEKEKKHYSLDDLKNIWIAKNNAPCMFISALEKQNLDNLRNLLYSKVKEIHLNRYPYDDLLYKDYSENLEDATETDMEEEELLG